METCGDCGRSFGGHLISKHRAHCQGSFPRAEQSSISNIDGRRSSSTDTQHVHRLRECKECECDAAFFDWLTSVFSKTSFPVPPSTIQSEAFENSIKPSPRIIFEQRMKYSDSGNHSHQARTPRFSVDIRRASRLKRSRSVNAISHAFGRRMR
jgi:hypothetical protein